MSAKRRHLLFALPVLLAGCNTPVRETRLKAVDERTALQWRSVVDERLRGQIGLGSIKGSDPEAVGYLQKTLQWTWRSRLDERTVSDALEEQLRLLRLFASMPGSGRYVLDVEVMQLDSDGYPFGSDGRAELRYLLRERAESGEGRLVYERRLRTQGELPWLPLLPNHRQRMARESALRANLAKLAEELVRLRV